MDSVLAWATACGAGGTVSPGPGSHHDFLSSSGGRECSDCGDAGFAAMWVVRESCPRYAFAQGPPTPPPTK